MECPRINQRKRANFIKNAQRTLIKSTFDSGPLTSPYVNTSQNTPFFCTQKKLLFYPYKRCKPSHASIKVSLFGVDCII